jgi:hypothetical protein
MESNEYEGFDIFNECLDDMFNVLPFHNFNEDETDQDFFDFLNIDMDFKIDKNIPDKSYEIIEKLNKIEENYNNIIHNSIQEPTISIYNNYRR